MNKYLFLLIVILFSLKIDAQILFESQSRGGNSRIPDGLDSCYVRLVIYNSSHSRIYKGLENRIGLSCKTIKKDKLVLGEHESLRHKEDYVRWKSSASGLWINEISTENDFGNAERWVDNDTLKWMRVYSFIPESLDSIRLKCYYLLNEADSIEIGSLVIPVHELPKPVLNISNKSSYPMEIEKEELLKLDKIESTSNDRFPDKNKYCKIEYFEFVIKKRKREIVIPWYDDYLSRDMKELIFKSKKGTQIIFRNIKSERIDFEEVKFRLK